jgi:hypothetical protein
MGNPSKPWLRGAVSLAVLVGLAAALVASPATAHFLHPSKGQVKKVAKKEATKVFNTKFPGAFDEAIAPIEAANQDKCVDGAVLAFATINGSTVTGPGFSSTGVLRQFNCAGGPIVVQDNGTGEYYVRVPGVTTPAPADEDRIAASVTVADDTGNIGSYESQAGEDFIRVVFINTAGASVDEEFSIVIFNKP